MEKKQRPPLEGPLKVFQIFGFESYFEVRKMITWLISRGIYTMVVLLEVGTYYRFYYRREGLTCTLECFSLLLTCLALDAMVWRAHWTMTYSDPGFLNDSKSIREASEGKREDFPELIESTISRITGLKDVDSPGWPEMMIKRCGDCGILKTNQAHHCSMCDKCVFLMDHHCCFSDRCVGYSSMKPFILFTGSVCVLTIVGLSTIWYNMVYRNPFDVEGGGLAGYGDFVHAMIFGRAELGFTFWTYFDICLIQASAGHGLFALWMFLAFLYNVHVNESTIDALKKGGLRHRGLAHQIKDRPSRSLK